VASVSGKPVSIAFEEIAAGKATYHRIDPEAEAAAAAADLIEDAILTEVKDEVADEVADEALDVAVAEAELGILDVGDEDPTAS